MATNLDDRYYHLMLDWKRVADRRLELLREIKEMLGYCPYCWANSKDPCADGCKIGKEFDDE